MKCQLEFGKFEFCKFEFGGSVSLRANLNLTKLNLANLNLAAVSVWRAAPTRGRGLTRVHTLLATAEWGHRVGPHQTTSRCKNHSQRLLSGRISALCESRAVWCSGRVVSLLSRAAAGSCCCCFLHRFRFQTENPTAAAAQSTLETTRATFFRSTAAYAGWPRRMGTGRQLEESDQ